MKEGNVILEKRFQFELRIIKLYLFLKEKKVDSVLYMQFLRSGTSIGANVEEAMGGSSKKDCAQKLTIPYEELRSILTSILNLMKTKGKRETSNYSLFIIN
ncbi:MAG: four helix bundle protein [Flavisolibacter sp.]|nr:four helix bundle protein [Flavisolibacter sp.]